MFIGRVSMKHIGATIGIAAIPVLILVLISMVYYDKDEGKTKELPALLETGRMPTWINRVQNFIYESKQTDKEENYQVNQAKIAIAKGGLMDWARATVNREIFYRILIRILSMQSS